MTQKELILRALQDAGPFGLTSMEILDLCGPARAAARVQELRDEGHNIETRRERTAKNAVVARYVLLPETTLFDAGQPTTPSTAHYERTAA